MGDYSEAADFYDILYGNEKDYPAEAALLASLIRRRNPAARSLLDVGCGTGSHARAFVEQGFEVAGVDIEPAFVRIARRKCPAGSFRIADMRTLDLTARFDVVVCLFSAIGYARDEPTLGATIQRLRAHLKPGGILLVDPWFEPGRLTHGWIALLSGSAGGITVCRMSRTVLDGAVSRLEFEYLIGTDDGIERRSERHELGLFTHAQMASAFRNCGLEVERQEEALRMRGLWVGVVPPLSFQVGGVVQ